MFGFGKKGKNEGKILTHNGVAIQIVNARKLENEEEEVDVLVLEDEGDNKADFELLARAEYLGKEYVLLTLFLEEELPEGEVSQVFVLQDVCDGENPGLLEVEDKEIVKRIFAAFHKASGDKYDFA